jgi:hypothetical protein
VILRRENILNNNGITTSHRQDQTITNVKMPSIRNKQQTSEHVSLTNLNILAESGGTRDEQSGPGTKIFFH